MTSIVPVVLWTSQRKRLALVPQQLGWERKHTVVKAPVVHQNHFILLQTQQRKGALRCARLYGAPSVQCASGKGLAPRQAEQHAAHGRQQSVRLVSFAHITVGFRLLGLGYKLRLLGFAHITLGFRA